MNWPYIATCLCSGSVIHLYNDRKFGDAHNRQVGEEFLLHFYDFYDKTQTNMELKKTTKKVKKLNFALIYAIGF